MPAQKLHLRSLSRHIRGRSLSRNTSNNDDVSTTPPLSRCASSLSILSPLSARAASSWNKIMSLGRNKNEDLSLADGYTSDGQDTYAVDEESLPPQFPLDDEDFVFKTSVADKVPLFQCEAHDSDGALTFRFDSTVPKSHFTVLCFFCSGEDWFQCERLMRKLEGMYQEFTGRVNCQFLAISVNQTKSELDAFSMGFGASFDMPMTADPSGSIFSMFAEGGVPRVVLLDRDYFILCQQYKKLSKAFIQRVNLLASEDTNIWGRPPPSARHNSLASAWYDEEDEGVGTPVHFAKEKFLAQSFELPRHRGS